MHSQAYANYAIGPSQVSLSNFQTGICIATYATLDTEQLISHIMTTLFNTVASPQGSNREGIPV